MSISVWVQAYFEQNIKSNRIEEKKNLIKTVINDKSDSDKKMVI